MAETPQEPEPPPGPAREPLLARLMGAGARSGIRVAEATGLDRAIEEVAEEAVALVDDQDEWDAARRLVQRRLPGLRRVDRVTAERRLVGMLARKGYGAGLAAWVVREALDDDRNGEDAVEPDVHDELGVDAHLP